MKKMTLLLTSLVIAGGSLGPVHAENQTHPTILAQTAPDNTGKNVRDREGDTLTPGDQSSDKGDVELTRRIREAVVDDKSLSTSAHNIKIITINGVVTLRGPVASAEEKTKIAETAKKLAGTKQVDNQLEVAAR
jgi:hyperosmotically inducible periplasmic protein